MCRLTTILLIGCCVGALPAIAEPDIVDPMRPPNTKNIVSSSAAGHKREWVVSQILVSQRRRLAVVNGRMVGVGDLVNGARVNAIYGNAVKLDINGESVLIAPVARDIKRQLK